MIRSSHPALCRLLAGSLLGAGALAAAATTPRLTALHQSPPRAERVRASRRPTPARGSGRRPLAPPATTLLDEVGRLAGPVPDTKASVWRTELKKARPAAGRAATLHLWLGEFELACRKQPETAIWHFRRARHLLTAADPGAGLAAYDTALAFYYAGRYEEARRAFQRLLAPEAAMRGYDRRRCALWYRRAGAAAGYHAEHARLGIPEPSRLDPLCGVAGLAVCLRELGLPADRERVAAACRHTGEGSDLGDLRAACPRLGLVGRTVTADETGLRLLPKPLIAHVEQDHFVAVVRADARGVSYICSDCGCWPGGRVNLTWRQWRALEAGPYLAVARPRSRAARLLAALPSDRNSQPAPVQLAAAGGLGRLHLSGVFLNQTLLGLLKGHVLLVYYPLGAAGCGLKPSTLHCFPWDSCPMDGPCGSSAGPSAGDPVNLATGEEEYQPGPDLTVYNPYGPSLVWSRTYHSLRGPDDDYESDDFGIGWSHPYNVLIKDPNYAPPTPNAMEKFLIFPNGCELGFTPAGVPSSANPTMPCTPANAGVPLVIQWVYDPSSAYGDYVVRFGDGTRWIFYTNGAGKVDNVHMIAWYQLGRIDNLLIRNPSSTSQYGGLVFQYNSTPGRSGFWRLTSIVDATSGSTLLTLDHPSAATGEIDRVKDAYGRFVYYRVRDHGTTGSNEVPYYLELEQVSQIQPGPMMNPPSRWSYGYTNYGNTVPGQTVPFLSGITVPSPSGSGSQTASITYSTTMPFVTSTQDANGTYRTYVPAMSGNQTQVEISTVPNPTGAQVLFSYTVQFNGSLERSLITDGTNNTNISSTPNNAIVIAYGQGSVPYRPTSITDGNGKQRVMNVNYFSLSATIRIPYSLACSLSCLACSMR